MEEKERRNIILQHYMHPEHHYRKEEYPKVKVCAMTSLWGSYNTAKHTVTLNLRLIEAPEECIEYVALHEVCHIIYPDHGKNFHALMDKLLPHNKSIRKKLKESVILN